MFFQKGFQSFTNKRCVAQDASGPSLIHSTSQHLKIRPKGRLSENSVDFTNTVCIVLQYLTLLNLKQDLAIYSILCRPFKYQCPVLHNGPHLPKNTYIKQCTVHVHYYYFKCSMVQIITEACYILFLY